MVNWQEYEVALERQADAQRQAEQRRLARQAELAAASQGSAREPLACQILAALGRQMVAAGMALQSRAATLEDALRRV